MKKKPKWLKDVKKFSHDPHDLSLKKHLAIALVNDLMNRPIFDVFDTIEDEDMNELMDDLYEVVDNVLNSRFIIIS